MSTAPVVNERLAALVAAGTSVWLDQIKRSLITSGELARMVAEDSLRGVTSNPAIFEKSMLGSDDYDEDLRAAAQEGLSTREVYRRLAVGDVQGAADVLMPVYEETKHLDGYVSFEVDPDLAFDNDRTIAQAREYWRMVDRPNLMIKIPGTTECLPAIEEAIADGINVNVTLLFGVAAYRRVMEAFIRGLERRHEKGESLDVHSVASFFVSRVDSEVDKRLEQIGRVDLQGRAGLANARAAYQAYKEVFHGERFAKLREAGAPVQRPLWASTGVKNPRYPDTLYVYGLVAPETVNTMPMPTLIAASQSGSVSGPSADDDPTEDLQALEQAGIDLVEVTDKLLADGVAAFVTPMEKLLAGIEAKREAIVTGRPPTIEADLPFEVEPAIGALVKKAEEEQVVRRIWQRDDTLWGPAGQAEVADRLGWLTICEKMDEDADEIVAFAQQCASDGMTDVVLLGMGGSSLAPEVFRKSLASAGGDGLLRLHVLDTTDPMAIGEVKNAVDLTKTVFLVSTKSGGTIETLSLAEYFYSRVGDGRTFVAITDPGSSLLDYAATHGFRKAFENDAEIGGRYSALSYFGLVPAALAGVDIKKVLDTAEIAVEVCSDFQNPGRNSGLWLGCAVGLLAQQGRDKLTFVVDEPIASFGLWAEQLIAESLGKQGKGALPVADEPLGDPGAYGEDRVFLHLRDSTNPDQDAAAKVDALRKAGHPTIVLNTNGLEDLGRIFFFAEFATAVAGWVLGVNPFDQPNVAQAKAATSAVLEHYEEHGQLPDPSERDPTTLEELVGGLRDGDYLAILGYLAPSDEVDEAIADLRVAIRERTKAATTFGYGPRYLHSTGQLHKGGPATGRFLMLLHDGEEDRPIPGRGFSFGVLKNAQAIGDHRTLEGAGREVAAIRLKGDLPTAIAELAYQVRKGG